jgi:hypothetical protein
MSNEQDQTEKKKPRIGGISQQRSQYRTIGGALQNSQTSERSNVQASEHSGAETPRSSTQVPERQDTQIKASKRPDAQEQTTKKRERHTIYLPPDLSRWIKIRAVLEDREISEIATEALQRYKNEIEHN